MSPRNSLRLARYVPTLCSAIAITAGTLAPAFSTPAFAQATNVAAAPGHVTFAAASAEDSEKLADGVVRFFASAETKKNALPSFALVKPMPSIGPVPAGFPVLVRMGSVGGASGAKVAAQVDFAPGTSLYGTGEVSGPLLRNGRTITTWNTDAYGYDDTAVSLYKSHPWVLAVRADGSAFGVLADTTYRCEVQVAGTPGSAGFVRFSAEGRQFPVIVIDKPSPQEVVAELAQLTGTITMPPKWAIGYHQCRYSYYPDARVQEIASEFRKRDIPCDVIWHDIDYMDGFRCFTWNKEYFPDPKAHNAWLHQNGFHNVWMIDPGIKAEEGYFVFDQGNTVDAWVKAADGTTDYNGEVWPGMCVFPDYTRKETRTWWAGIYKDFMATGIDGVWNDMNEPAVFNVKSKTMPEENVHRADAELGGPGTHARYHNVYGMLMVKASREGIMAANPDKRPFVLSRAGYMGSHRYAASWTGDNTADWPHLEESISMTLNLGLSGQPFSGPDIGGFAGNGPAGQEGKLFARWMGFGSMLPFSRGHTGKGNIDKEPWSFGPEVEKTCKAALDRRYLFMPYYYTLFHEAATIGLPVARPLFFADPKDQALRSEDDAFLIGDGLMVVAQVVPDSTRVPVLPKGIWHKLAFEGEAGVADLPDLYLRGGSIVPAGPKIEFVDEKPLNPLTLYVALDANGKADGTLYEDAGEGWGYQKGEFLLSTYHAEKKGDTISVTLKKSEGSMKRPDRGIVVNVVDAGADGSPRVSSGNGRDGAEVSVTVKK